MKTDCPSASDSTPRKPCFLYETQLQVVPHLQTVVGLLAITNQPHRSLGDWLIPTLPYQTDQQKYISNFVWDRRSVLYFIKMESRANKRNLAGWYIYVLTIVKPSQRRLVAPIWMRKHLSVTRFIVSVKTRANHLAGIKGWYLPHYKVADTTL